MTILAKKSLGGTILPALALIIGVSSCRPKQEGGQFIPVPRDTSALGKVNHFIPVEDINKFKSAFASQRDSIARNFPGLFIPLSETFNKQALLNLLKDSTNVGIRIYYGLKAGGNRNEVRLVLVGVNSQGQDLFYLNGAEEGKISAKVPPPPLSGGVEYGQCTPPCFMESR